MATIDYTEKEIRLKIVLCGPAYSGKSTILSYLRENVDMPVPPEIENRVSGADQILSMEINLPHVTLQEEMKTFVELYTVPGEVTFNAPRQLVLSQVDGILFVADSQFECMEANVAAFRNLEENLLKLELDFNDTPCVLLFNKRDLNSVAPVAYMDFLFNQGPRRMKFFETVATRGENIFNSLNALGEQIVHRLLNPEATGTQGSLYQGFFPVS